MIIRFSYILISFWILGLVGIMVVWVVICVFCICILVFLGFLKEERNRWKKKIKNGINGKVNFYWVSYVFIDVNLIFVLIVS